MIKKRFKRTSYLSDNETFTTFKAMKTYDKEKEIIKIVCTAIISITAVLTAQSCTMSLSVSKNNSNSTQKTEQTTTSSVDSTQININPKK